jgi:hypothetical protein
MVQNDGNGAGKNSGQAERYPECWMTRAHDDTL